MEQNSEYKNFWRGENLQFFPDQQTVFKVSFPRVFIRYHVNEKIFIDYEAFYSGIEEITWMDENKPTSDDLEKILKEAWGFLVIEERMMEKGG